METGNGVVAWVFLRRVEAYEAAWREYRESAGTSERPEPGPFPIRVQTEMDLAAARFDLLAWENPWRNGGPASPFWVQTGMLRGLLDPEAEPVTAMVAEGGSVEGLRLLSGDLVLKVEYRGAVVQVRIRGVGRFPEDGAVSINLPFGLRVPHPAQRMLDFWSAAGRPVPRNGTGRWARIASWSEW